MNRPCPACGTPLDSALREEFCPVCALRGALERDSQTPLFPVLDRRIGAYQLVREIARGGVGVVFEARQETLCRNVALKLLIAGQLADTATRRRFHAEAGAAARLRHPNIVTVHEVGEHEAQPFIAMELLEGGTLTDLVREQPLPSRRAAELGRQLALAVGCAHEAGILHRDLKPSNILLDTFGQPRITDFGLAKVLNSDGNVTLTGQTLGSPSYMSPEQAAGDAAAIGIATDIYALGAILYHLVTSHPPFQGDNARAVLRRVGSEDPVPPRRLNPGVPADLETVILKCLEKTPARRYATAQDLAAELDRFIRGQPVHARPVGVVERGWRWCRRRPRVAALSLTTLVLLCTVAVGSTITAYRIKRSEHAAQHRLAESLVSQARALRLAGKPGQRDQSLALVREAMALVPAPHQLNDALRHEAIAALALPELRKTLLTNLPPSGDIMLTCFDREFTRCFLSPPDGSIRLFDVTTGRSLLTLPFNTRQVDEVLGFADDGRCVALRLGRRVCVWDLEANRAAITTNRSLGAGEFSTSGGYYARGETNGTVGIYELPSGDLRARIEANAKKPVSGIAWSADEKALAVVREDGSTSVHLLSDASMLWHRLLPARSRRLAWNAALNQLATVGGSDRVLLLDAASGEVLTEIRTSVEESTDLDFSPDGESLAVGSEGGGIRLFDARSGEARLSDAVGAWHLQFDRAGRRIGGVWKHGRVGWLEYGPSTIMQTLRPPAPAGEHPSINFSPDGRWLVSTGEGELILWQLPAGRVAARLEARDVFEALFDARSEQLFAGSQKGLLAWRRDGDQWTPRKLTDHNLSGKRYQGVAHSVAGKAVAIADHGAGKIDLLNSTTLALEHSLDSVDNVSGLAWSPDGRWLYGGACRPHGAFLWDVERGVRVNALPRQAGCQAAFSPDGQWLVTFGMNCSLWRVGTWERGPALPLEANNKVEFSAAFHPNSRLLAVTQHDREVHLLDIASAARVAVLEAPGEGRIHGLRFSPDGHILAAARNRGEIQCWNLEAIRGKLASLGLNW